MADLIRAEQDSPRTLWGTKVRYSTAQFDYALTKVSRYRSLTLDCKTVSQHLALEFFVWQIFNPRNQMSFYY